MRICGIVRGKRRTITTESDPSADRHPDLIDRQWNTPTRPDQWWVADFTYVWTLAGFCYVSFVVDVYSRRILGWRASMTRRSDLVLSTLEQAIDTRRRRSIADRIRGDVPFQPGDRTSDGLTQQDPPTEPGQFTISTRARWKSRSRRPPQRPSLSDGTTRPATARQSRRELRPPPALSPPRARTRSAS